MSAVAIPLPNMIRIRVTGADRVRFLHNFCTNDIEGLTPGHLCEAFFVNVKARALAHGYILADTDGHEIWMLPGDESQLLNHLTRYLITEDVEFESLTGGTSAVAVLGDETLPDLADSAVRTGEWADISCSGVDVRCMTVQWNGTTLRLISGPADASDSLASQSSGEPSPSNIAEFERLRILERFPLIGSDLSADHLAPESLRNSTAISYTKGCYLGQEPIARLDAMGQVNRVLAALDIHDEVSAGDHVYDLTSFDDSMTPHIGMAVVRTADLEAESVVVRTPFGTLRAATITKPTSLTGD